MCQGKLQDSENLRRYPGMNMVDITAVQKIARAFGISIRDLIEVLEE